jgi:Rps23 Pro-64 3,4-dihydroxylase Tpa1-like proline 4-hydroxylase
MNQIKFDGVNPFDAQALKRTMQKAPAFPHFCMDNFFESEFANSIHDAFPSYEDASKIGTSFSAVNEKKKVQVTDSKLFPPPIARLNSMLASTAFLEMLSEITGIPDLLADPGLAGGGIHETNHGGHLDVHVDFNFNEHTALHRRVNLLFYFNKDWSDGYGGVLDLWNKDVTECVGKFAPIFNRAAGFVTSEISWHGVTPVTCPPSTMRKSFAVYYYTKEPPPGWNGEIHSTIFKARPDEYWKGLFAMPAENAVRSIAKGKDTLKQGLKSFLKK